MSLAYSSKPLPDFEVSGNRESLRNAVDQNTTAVIVSTRVKAKEVSLYDDSNTIPGRRIIRVGDKKQRYPTISKKQRKRRADELSEEAKCSSRIISLLREPTAMKDSLSE